MKKFLLTLLVVFFAYYTAFITSGASEKQTFLSFGSSPVFYKLYCLLSGSTDTTSATSINERALNYKDQQNYELAIKDFKKVLELDSTFSSAYFDLSRIYMAKGDTSLAVKTLNLYSINALYPDEVFVELALIYTAKGNKDSSVFYYNKALETNKLNGNIYYKLANIYFNDSVFDLALENISQAVVLSPNELDYHNLKRLIHLKQNNQQLADQEYNYIAENNPEYFGKHEENAKAAFDQNNFQTAVEEYKLALLNKPNDRIILENKAWAYHQLNYLDSSLTDYKLVCKLYPDYLSYFNLAYLLDVMNKIEESIANYTKSIELKDDYYISYNNRGYEYYRLNKFKEAEKDYTKSINLEPKYYLNNYNRAILYAKLQKHDKAITDYLNAMQYDNNANIHYDLALSYDKLKRKQDAINSFNEYLKLSDQTDSVRVNYATERVTELNKQ